MNWEIGIFLAAIMILVILIGTTLVSLVKLGDERKNMIKMKAQSYAFAVVVFMLLFNIARNTYVTTWGDGEYEGVNAFSFLAAISILYLILLLVFKKKYGG